MNVLSDDELSHESCLEDKEICVPFNQGSDVSEIPDKDPLEIDLEKIKKEPKVFDGEVYPSSSHDCASFEMSPSHIIWIKEEPSIEDEIEIDYDEVKEEICKDEDDRLSPALKEVKEEESSILDPCDELSTSHENNIGKTDSASCIDNRTEINNCTDGNNGSKSFFHSSTSSIDASTGEDNFICNHCKKTFLDLSNLKSEIVTQTGHKVYICNNCQKPGTIVIFSSYIDENSFICKICNTSFSDSTSLKRHVHIHAIKPFICKSCSKGFCSSSNLKKHMRTHTGEKPFICKTCNKGFTRSDILKTHLLSHTKDKPFICNICNEACTSSRNLKTHIRTHTGEKPFMCNICDKVFSESSNLKRHLSTHVGGKPFICQILQ